jgi:SH3 domain protein
MLNLKKISVILNIGMTCVLFIASLAHAEDRYVTNAVNAGLHEGPGSQYKIIKTLPSDQSFEVLETLNNFVRIRTKDGVEGWVPDKFTDTRSLEGSASKDTDEKVDTPTPKPKTPPISGRVTAKAPDTLMDSQPKKEFSEQSSAKESIEIKKLQAELSELTKQFNQAETSATVAEQLKIDYDTLNAKSSAMQNTIAELQQSNTSLANKNNIYWFLAGSAVFFLGWLVGRISLRRQRHSSLTL